MSEILYNNKETSKKYEREYYIMHLYTFQRIKPMVAFDSFYYKDTFLFHYILLFVPPGTRKHTLPTKAKDNVRV